MASIERTAYPRLKHHLTATELAAVYTPTTEEIVFARETARGASGVLHLLVMLKAFQRLGYFPPLDEVPASITNHLCACLNAPADTTTSAPQRSLYRYQKAIREYLGITPYGQRALHIAIHAVATSARAMDNPADLINVAIEELIKQRCELPAFSTLDRLVRRVRTLINSQFFRQVLSRLTVEEQMHLDELLLTDNPRRRSDFAAIKEPPRSATLSHMYDIHTKLTWLLTFGDITRLLSAIPHAKLIHWAAEAKSLDADQMRAMTAPKRYTLLLCLLHRAQVQARDHLVEMFLKRINKMHRQGKEELLRIQEQQRTTTDHLIGTLTEILEAAGDLANETALGRRVQEVLIARGGAAQLRGDCAAISAYSGNNYYPLLWKFYRPYRSILCKMVRLLAIHSTTQDQSLVAALSHMLEHENSRRGLLPEEIDISFASEPWQRCVLVRRGDLHFFDRRNLEVCIFSHLAAELKTGDLYVEGSEEYADYRTQLLSWEECEPQVVDYCRHIGIASQAKNFVADLRTWLEEAARKADEGFPVNDQLMINEHREPVLKRLPRKEDPHSLAALEAAITARMPERNLLDILRNVNHWAHWTRHFGPLSGSDPKLERPTERYIFTTFGYGCLLGPTQTARHTRGAVTPHMLTLVNRRHITAEKLDASLRDIINIYSQCSLPKCWGTGKAAAADGTKYDLYEENLLSEYHIRYGSYGGVAYHHVSDLYIALFSHFIACGVWEAIYIIDGLLKNTSDVQPDTVHADTQGQSAPVFGLAHLLGIKLMPRIRNWKDLVFYRPDKRATYQHIDLLFRDTIDWELIETHWPDLLRVALSIKAGRVLPSTLLRKLSNYSRKNKLYQAFRELGHVIRTVFLLQYITDPVMRRQITACTNKVEAYHGFSKWLGFGGDGVITENDPDEQEKRIKYNDLVANACILQNVVDMTEVIRQLIAEGHEVTREAVQALSPYLTRHIRRFGDYVLDMEVLPAPMRGELALLN